MKPIWIVDDDQSIRWVLEKALARENFTTRSFSGVRDALAALVAEQFGFQQILRNRRRVQRDEGSVRARAMSVQGACNKLLSGA